MSSNDPWSAIPNLSGQEAGALEQTRTADPSRFYSSPRGGEVDAVAGRILNGPRCKVNFPVGVIGVGTTAAVVAAANVEYDTDHMARPPSMVITTPGLYMLSANATYYGGPAGVAAFWTRIWLNVVAGAALVDATSRQDSSLTGISHCLSVPCELKTGDVIILTGTPDVGVNFLGWLSAIFIHALGSDNQ